MLLTRFALALLLLRTIALVLLEELRGGRVRLKVNLRARFASNATVRDSSLLSRKLFNQSAGTLP